MNWPDVASAICWSALGAATWISGWYSGRAYQARRAAALVRALGPAAMAVECLGGPMDGILSPPAPFVVHHGDRDTMYVFDLEHRVYRARACSTTSGGETR